MNDEPTGAQADEPRTTVANWQRWFAQSGPMMLLVGADKDDLLTLLESLQRDLEAARGEIEAWRKQANLLTHQVITCGVAASHPDATLSGRAKDYGGPWNSKQAEEVRTLRADRDSLRAQLASAAAELGNIAHAKRFDRAVFWSDTEFADWAQSRCHAALSSDAAANKEREP